MIVELLESPVSSTVLASGAVPSRVLALLDGGRPTPKPRAGSRAAPKAPPKEVYCSVRACESSTPQQLSFKEGQLFEVKRKKERWWEVIMLPTDAAAGQAGQQEHGWVPARALQLQTATG